MSDSDRQSAFLWKPENVARRLQIRPEKIQSWVSEGLITEADGLIKVGEQHRFIRLVVLARIETGRFAEGQACLRRGIPS
jgi:hypothetical protein